MPQTVQETWTWVQRLGLAALGAKTEPCGINNAEDSEGMLADARFLVGAIVVPRGAPLFQWQKDSIDGNTRDHCFQEWSQAYSQAVSPLFTGCTIEYLQPDAYYVSKIGRASCRERVCQYV